MALLGDAHRHRETRLFQMALRVPPAPRALLLLFSAVLAGFVVLAAAENTAAQAAFAGLFAGTLAAVLVTVHMLDRPFAGALRLPPADFRETLTKVLALGAGGG